MVEHAVRSIGAKKRSMVDLVTVEIRRSILVGALSPGEPFSVDHLAGQLGVSHIPVREALRRLEGEGLIVLNRAKSASVAPLTVEDVQGIYGLRLLIEPELAARSAREHSPEQHERLNRLLDEIAGPDPELAWQSHQEFHAALVEPAASDWDMGTLERLWAAAQRYTRLVFDPATITEQERTRRRDLHAVILDRVIEGDTRGVRRELRDHLRENEVNMVERIGRLETAKADRASD